MAAQAVAVELATQAAVEVANQIASYHRNITVTLKNETPFHLVGLKMHFKSGDVRVLPAAAVPPGEATVFGVSSKPGFYGVEGAVCYKISGADLAVYFNNPFMGRNDYAADIFFNDLSARDAFDLIREERRDSGTPVTRQQRQFQIYCLGGAGNSSNQEIIVTHSSRRR